MNRSQVAVVVEIKIMTCLNAEFVVALINRIQSDNVSTTC